MRLVLQTRGLIDGSKGLLESVDEYKTTLSGSLLCSALLCSLLCQANPVGKKLEKAKAKVKQQAQSVKQNVQSIAKSVSSAVREEAERIIEIKERILAAQSSEES